MKKYIIRCLLAAALAAIPGAIQAQPAAHYVPGVEGIQGASLPPVGLYFKDYNAVYAADQINDASGNAIPGKDPQLLIYANVPRVLWITDMTFLGANVGVDGFLPLIYKSFKGGQPANTFGIGDLFAESTLSWHLKQLDVAAGAGIYLPTGDSSLNQFSTRIGSGFWTPMLTAGATWYADADKTWAFSALNRYEFNSEKTDSDKTVGQVYTMEWGISKLLLNKTLNCGLVGYFQQKVTADTGDNVAPSLPNRVAAIGPEVVLTIPSYKLFVSLRYNYEFMAENRMQGHTVALTLTKAF